MAATARAVDLTNVKEGGNFRPRRKPEGDYLAKVVKADDHQPNDKSKPMGWVLTIQIDGDARSTYPYYLSPDAKQAWKIRTICIACGLKPPAGRIKFDPNKLVNKVLGVALADDEYEGRPKSVIDDVFTKDEVGGNADEDIPEGDEDIDLGDEEEVEEDVEEEEEPPPPPKRRRAAKPAPEPEPEEEDEEEEEEEEEAPPVRKRRTTPPTKAVAPARRTRKPAPVVEEDEEDDLDLDDLED